jgi:exopolysaccharide production protein ExoQ
MNPSVATVVYICGIAGLFFLDRDKSVRTSKALWLPVVYIWILGSRPVSAWLGITPPLGTDVQLDGSPVDRIIFAILLIMAIGVLVRRGRGVVTVLTANWPILIYFLYCLASVFWSPYPDVALKRWIKAIGDVVMILIVVTDEQPVPALRRLFSRVGFILLPVSLLFIKYYPNLGRGFEPWSGAPMDYGVTLDKNELGVITLVLLLGAIWRVLPLLRSDKNRPDRRRCLIAQGALLVLGIALLKFANSDTSTVSFVFGATLLLVTSLRFFRRNPTAVHVFVLALVFIVGSWVTLGGVASVAHALGRNSHLTGRTDIWAAVIPLAPDPLVGAGFESFWLSPRVHERLWELFPGLPLNEAHNGYIEVYLELGWVGVVLIVFMLLDGYRRSVAAFRREPAIGGLLIAYVVCAIVYSMTEAGFRMLDPIWIFFLLAVVEASSIAVVKRSEGGDTSTVGPRRVAAGSGLGVIPVRRSGFGTSRDADKGSKVAGAYRPVKSSALKSN